MNLNHLNYFKEVCRCGSITAAAEVCHISQPSITSAIGNLEIETGLHLFNHTGNRLTLTEDGNAFLNLTLNFLNSYDDYIKSIADISMHNSTLLKLGVPSVLGTFIFGKIIPLFEMEHPNIKLEIFETASIDGLNMLKKNELDCMIAISDGNVPDMISHPLFETDLRLAVSKANPLARETLITKDILKHTPLTIISKGSYHYDAITHMYPDLRLNVVMHSNQVSTIRRLLLNDNVATIIYKEVFEDDDRIVNIPLEKSIPAKISIFRQNDRYCSKSLQTFISFISRQLNDGCIKHAY